MDVQFTDEQNLLRESARDFLTKECPMAYVREMMDDAAGCTDEQWEKVAALGWTGLVVGEEYGGAGLGLVDLAVLLEETGRALMPGPFFSTVAVGSTAIALAGSDEQKRRILPGIAAGSTRVALAQLEADGTWGAEGIGLEAATASGGYRLSGEKLFATDGQTADLLIVPVRSKGAVTLLALPKDSPGLSVEPIAYTDATRKVAAVRFADVAAGPETVLGKAGDGWPVLQRVLDYAKVALCAEMIGGAQAVMDLSVEYAKTREQFGSPIGRFQAIQHKCATMLVLVESAKSAAYYAAWAIDNDEPDAHACACMAKAYCADAFTRVAGEGIQIHGGMGFTWEADLHLYYKRAKASELAFGDPVWNRELAARALIDE